MEHTKGDWHVDGHNLCAVIAQQGDIDYHPKYQHVCTCDYGYEKPLEYLELNKANAVLISAAPDMLKALIDLCAAKPNDNTYNYPAAYAQAQRAIKKATNNGN